MYCVCEMELEPLEPGSGITFENKTVGGSVPREYVAPIEAGVREAALSGVVANYPMVDIAVRLIDGSYHDVDSNEMAFKMAGSIGFREAARKGAPQVLEPVMKVETTTPEDFLGEVVGDLNRRRGQIQGMEPRANTQTVRAMVPLAEMFGYATDLRSATQGRASYSMEFSHYQPVPKAVETGILAKARA
jgi:elongation factor G